MATLNDKKVALITGAAYGIGASVAYKLAEDGYDIALAAEVEPSGTADAIKSLRRNVVSFAGDFRDPAQAEKFVEFANKKFGRVDVLVNNAGITLNKPIDECTLDDFNALFAVNVAALWSASKAAATIMKKSGGGVIINMSSIHASSALPNHSIYAATKGAINALTRELAIELAPFHIRVNAIAPGLIEVPRITKIAGYDPLKSSASIPIARAGAPDEVAGLVSYLVSDQSAYITGQILSIDGGLSARNAYYV